MRFPFVPLLAALGLFVAPATRAAHDVAPFSRELAVHHVVHARDTIETRTTETIRILNAAGVHENQRLDLASLYYGRVPEEVSGQIVRADGTRLLLPKVSIPDGGNKAGFELPPVSPGDVITLHTIGGLKANALGGASIVQVFPASARLIKAEISVSGEHLASVAQESHGFDVVRKVGPEGVTMVYSLQPQPHRPDEPGAVHPIDFAPRLVMSTWQSYDDMGRKLAKIALTSDHELANVSSNARAAVSDAVGHRAKAMAILNALIREFVVETQHSTVMAAFRSLDQVQVQKRGSRFDLARLYRALLAAEGIEGEIILTNLQALYSLPKVPVPAFDAALVHIPALDAYVDPSAQVMSFGVLHPAYAGKMGLKLGANAALFVIAPRLSAQDNRTRVLSEVSVSAEGGVEGNTRIEGHGGAGIVLRQNIARLASAGNAQDMQSLLRRQNMTGEAKLSKAETNHHADPFVADMSFRIHGETGRDKAVRVPISAGPRLIRPPQVDLVTALREERTQPFPCLPQSFEQDIVLHLPPTDMPYATPPNVAVRVAHASYEANYTLKGNVLNARRRFVLNVPGFVCTLETARDLAPAVKAAGRDMRRMLDVRGGDD